MAAVPAAILALLLVLAGASAGLAQTSGACPQVLGPGQLTPASIGGGIRDGHGIGAANLGSTPVEIERAWGVPESCAPQRAGSSYTYFLTADGGQTGWLVVVRFVDGKASDIAVTAVPHAKAPGPRIQTARGVGIFDTEDDVRRRYGAPTLTAERTAVYGSEGIAFWLSRGQVGGIFVFRPGTTPSGLRP